MTVLIDHSAKKETIWLDAYGNIINWPRGSIISAKDSSIDSDETNVGQPLEGETGEDEDDGDSKTE